MSLIVCWLGGHLLNSIVMTVDLENCFEDSFEMDSMEGVASCFYNSF